ncbi:hypothetical protein [Parvularcula sp. LCG005]|uniref:hypothetical protein n=1 Tax=Parvularcula sp. LCG005 TaxID=3078805 RepID=UPI002942FA86|nr:hypothetical protein [Parvularcula sp. LCG005]WOI51965.1 hypothetical protein RUI03_07325 [Parvularcula sp. LCG005]
MPRKLIKKHDLHYETIGHITCPSCAREGLPLKVNQNMSVYANCSRALNTPAPGERAERCLHRQVYDSRKSASLINTYRNQTEPKEQGHAEPVKTTPDDTRTDGRTEERPVADERGERRDDGIDLWY